MRKELAGKDNRFRVKSGDWDGVLEAWLRGESYESIFADLPSCGRSTITPAIEEWLGGLDHPTKWAPEFEKFVEVMRDAVESFLSWLCRACGNLAGHAGGWAVDWDWDGSADFLEHGVDSLWAVNARKAARLRTGGALPSSAGAGRPKQLPTKTRSACRSWATRPANPRSCICSTQGWRMPTPPSRPPNKSFRVCKSGYGNRRAWTPTKQTWNNAASAGPAGRENGVNSSLYS